MLTEQERKWLENRKIRCSRCVHYEVSGVGGICFWCADMEKFETSAYTLASDYRDAAEFAERVAAKLTLEEPCPLPENADLDDCPYFTEDDGSAFSCRWCRLKRARIAVEEEMDECLSPRL